ncbi:MAG: CHAT domain-containing protein [Chloroflexota bacterium]|nr:CHAT domain-containing protein [Chloroflexota bacterium]
MLAFLSAANISARGEWDALYSALRKARLPIDLKVFIAEPDLEEHINQRAKSPKIKVEVNLIKVDEKSLAFRFADVIENADFSPHIIHFFCHGLSATGPTLELATRAGWEQGESDIKLGPEDFRDIPGLDKHLWMVTLNCCEGAAVGGETSSFARTLVADLKVPAVVAMREAVTVENANIFCGAFYTALLREIKPSLGTGDAFVDVEWARALYDPRFSICKAYAASNNTKMSSAAAANKEWAIPVIYVRAGEFKLRAISPQSPLSAPERLAKRAEIEQLQQVLDDLPSDTPRGAIADIKKHIASLEAELLLG